MENVALINFLDSLNPKSFKRVTALLKKEMLDNRQYELASQLKSYEDAKYPPSQEEEAAVKEATDAATALRMVDINITDLKTAWVIKKGLDRFNELGGKYSVKDAAEIIAKSEEIFG